jgi:MFS transporter, DHA1 family, multidrug resistance protein
MATVARHREPSLLLGAAGFCSNMSWQVILPILSLHLAHLGFDVSQVGLVVGLFSLTMGVVELQAGVIAAAVGRRTALLGALAAHAVCLSIAGLGHARWLVAAAFAAAGATRGVLVPPLHATVADSAPPERRGRAFGVFWLCTSLASLAGPALGGFVASHAGGGAPFAVAALFSLAAIPLLAALGVPRRAAGGAAAVDFAAFLGSPSVVRLGVSMLLCYSLVGIWITFLPLYAARQGISLVTIGWIFAIQGGAYALMQVPTGRLAALEHGRWLAVAGIAVMTGTVFAVPLIHGASLLAAGALFGMASGIMPVTFAMQFTQRVTPDLYTAALSVYNSAIDLGLFAGPLLGAAVAAAASTVAAPFLLALPVGVAAVAIVRRVPSGVAQPWPEQASP